MVLQTFALPLGYGALVTPRGFEPLLPPWKGGVLTAWPWSQYSIIIYYRTFKTTYTKPKPCRHLPLHWFLSFWSSPRPISSSQLHTLLHFHLCPIYLVVFKGSYFLRMGYLILRGASRLDAFSVYPVPTWLLCHAVGTTTDTPATCPSRSSRTKDSSSQISYAHAG